MTKKQTYKEQLIDAFYRGVYQILISKAGATTSPMLITKDDEVVFLDFDLDNFLSHHSCDEKERCAEWRFQGKLGFGGKYWSNSNSVNFYTEDTTIEREQIKITTNQLLKEWKDKFDKFVGEEFSL